MELIHKYSRTLHKLEICLELLIFKKYTLGIEVAKKLIEDVKAERDSNTHNLIHTLNIPIMYNPEEAFNFINNYINK